jgi:3',5'-cyclic AMP phosphodiesterase CpdA
MLATRLQSLVAVLAVATARAAAGKGHFLVMGDWGGQIRAPYTTPQELDTARGMEAVAAGSNSTHVLALGDNMYYLGVLSDESHRFHDTFEKVFTGPRLDALPFHVIAGNHDHYGRVQAQVAYTQRSRRWSFPSLWYSWVETMGSGPDRATVEFVLFDSVVLAGNSLRRIETEAEDEAAGLWDRIFHGDGALSADAVAAHEALAREGGSRLLSLAGSALPGPSSAEAAATQLEWLAKTLAASEADFLVVGAHYPVHSVCEHGPTAFLVERVQPLLERHGASVYLSGHDHCAEHIDVGDGVQYHVVGAAHGSDASTAHMHTLEKGQLKFYSSEDDRGGFASVSVGREGLVVSHHAGNGTVLYTAPPVPKRSRRRTPLPAAPAAVAAA